MPLPDRKLGEKAEEFVSRCMSSEKMMNEFSDQKQRYAVCKQQASKAQEIEYKSKWKKSKAHTPQEHIDRLTEMLRTWEDKQHPYYKDLAGYVAELMTQDYDNDSNLVQEEPGIDY